MKSSNKYIIKVLTTGFVTLTLISILLFWARKACQAVFYETLVVGNIGQVAIQPSGLLPELDKNPDVVVQSYVSAYIENDIIADSLGIVRNMGNLVHSRETEFCIITDLKSLKNPHLILFDKHKGLFTLYDVFKAKRGWGRKVKLYAGPQGIGSTADKNLGRFSLPRPNLCSYLGGEYFIFYDKLQTCFFQINFPQKSVIKSTHLPDVIQIGNFNGLAKGEDSLRSLKFSPPRRKQTPQDKQAGKKVLSADRGGDNPLVSAADYPIATASTEYILILLSNGEIKRLHLKTLDISGPVGFLPSAHDSVHKAQPQELFAYEAKPVTVNGKYSGTIVTEISREAMKIQVAVFGPDGNLITSNNSSIGAFRKAGGPALLITNYLLENLQPSLFGLLSYCTASSFEAVDGHAGLFILPNSFVAIINRDKRDDLGSFLATLIIISPSIVLGLLLGFAVYKSGEVVGLSRRARRFWLYGTILFGLSAYITYRLTKPAETLITCRNCGKMRRPDMSNCHRCGGGVADPRTNPTSLARLIQTDRQLNATLQFFYLVYPFTRLSVYLSSSICG